MQDSKGLVCASRTDLQHHKKPFAHDVPPCKTLLEAVQQLRPTALIGVSTVAGAFTEDVFKVRALRSCGACPIRQQVGGARPA